MCMCNCKIDFPARASARSGCPSFSSRDGTGIGTRSKLSEETWHKINRDFVTCTFWTNRNQTIRRWGEVRCQESLEYLCVQWYNPQVYNYYLSFHRHFMFHRHLLLFNDMHDRVIANYFRWLFIVTCYYFMLGDNHYNVPFWRWTHL